VAAAVGGSEEGRGGRGKLGARVAGFGGVAGLNYTRVPKNQGLSRVEQNILHLRSLEKE
jgi:hypothetical protein